MSESLILSEIRSAMPDVSIHTLGEISAILNPVLYRVSLPNGKLIPAHLSKALSQTQAVFAVGQRVVLEMTTYDFDQARILGLAETC